MIDLRALFDQEPPTDRFKDINEELQAISAGIKAMSVISVPRSELGTVEIEPILQTALDLGLLTAFHLEKIFRGTSAPYEQVYVFIFNRGQEWRIPAYIATRQILRKYRWSDGAEYFESYLLGYSESEILAWMAHHQKTRASWTGLTVYLLMSKRQIEPIRYLGMRCIDPKSVTADVIAFFSRSNLAIRSDAKSMIPKGFILLRVAIKRSLLKILFGPPNSWGDAEIVSTTITADLAKLMNPALESNFQTFDGGWR